MSKIIFFILKIIFITNALLIAICFESMIIRMSILFLMYSFIIFLILKKWRE